MNKAELTMKIYKNVPFNKEDTFKLVDNIIEILIEALKQNKRIEIRGFGILKTRHRKFRLGKNPRTNEPAEIKEAYIPKFVPGVFLKDI